MTIQSEKSRIERLVGLCKLWSAIKFFHPYLAYRDDIDWDAALITAVPKANSADNAMDYANAIQQLLSALNDPATRVTEQHYGSNNDQSVHAKEFTYTSTQDRLLIVSLNNYQELLDFNSIEEKFRAIKLEIPDANGILFDLRATAQLPEARGLLSFAFNWSGIATVLSATPYFTLNHRSRMHQGFVPQSGATSGDYASSFRVIDGRRIMPVPNSNDIPMVWLVNAWSELPPEALALQRLGKAMIIVEGEVSDAALVKTHRVLLYDDVVAEIRLSEVVGSDDFVGFEADAMIPVSQPTGQSDQSLELALSLLRDFRPGKIVQKSSLAPAVSPLERSYSEMQFPPVEYRLMAAFRIWSVINYFFPYKALIEEDWDDVLREFILKMEQVDSALAYHLAVAEMITHIHDSHGFVGSPILDEHFGVAGPPIRLQWIDNMPVVTAICDQEIVNAAGLSLGDVILKIDGGDIQGRIEYCAKYKAVSTPQQRTYHAINRSLFGLDGTTVVLTIQDRDDAVKDVILPRSAKYSCHERSGAVFRFLSNDIGYADLDRLEGSMVDKMFETFKNTKAIVFDMRGYPKGTAWVIAPRLSQQNGVHAALIHCPIVMMPDGVSGDIASQYIISTMVQSLPTTEKWRYAGKTVMLVDERTGSQAEHTGLFFSAANGTKFVGSHTAGANGDVTNFYVPGGINIYFSGQSISHADGRQLQRIGLVPDIEVRPTIKGIQDGRDEVLESAITHLQNATAIA